MHEEMEEILQDAAKSPDLLTEELQKLDPGELWDVIVGNEAITEVRKRQEHRALCAAHEQSLGDRLERAVWEHFVARHGKGSRPPGMNRPQLVRSGGKGFG